MYNQNLQSLFSIHNSDKGILFHRCYRWLNMSVSMLYYPKKKQGGHNTFN